MILVRATVKLAGLQLGAVVLVDADDAFIVACLGAGYLVPVSDGS